MSLKSLSVATTVAFSLASAQVLAGASPTPAEQDPGICDRINTEAAKLASPSIGHGDKTSPEIAFLGAWGLTAIEEGRRQALRMAGCLDTQASDTPTAPEPVQ